MTENPIEIQARQGKLTADQQAAMLQRGMVISIYGPVERGVHTHVGKIVRHHQPNNTGCTIEDARGIRYSAPYGDRIRLIAEHGDTAQRPRLFTGDLFAPL